MTEAWEEVLRNLNSPARRAQPISPSVLAAFNLPRLIPFPLIAAQMLAALNVYWGRRRLGTRVLGQRRTQRVRRNNRLALFFVHSSLRSTRLAVGRGALSFLVNPPVPQQAGSRQSAIPDPLIIDLNPWLQSCHLLERSCQEFTSQGACAGWNDDAVMHRERRHTSSNKGKHGLDDDLALPEHQVSPTETRAADMPIIGWPCFNPAVAGRGLEARSWGARCCFQASGGHRERASLSHGGGRISGC